MHGPAALSSCQFPYRVLTIVKELRLQKSEEGDDSDLADLITFQDWVKVSKSSPVVITHTDGYFQHGYEPLLNQALAIRNSLWTWYYEFPEDAFQFGNYGQTCAGEFNRPCPYGSVITEHTGLVDLVRHPLDSEGARHMTCRIDGKCWLCVSLMRSESQLALRAHLKSRSRDGKIICQGSQSCDEEVVHPYEFCSIHLKMRQDNSECLAKH